MQVSRLAIAIGVACLSLPAQVLSPAEITDMAARGLQQKYLAELKAIGAAIKSHKFPFHFYLSRKLDLKEVQEQSSDQRAIQFDNFQGQLVLKITGNYFASYSSELITENERARATYLDVILPILREAVPKFNDAGQPQAYAFEISHHVRKKILGVTNEEAENVVLVLPKSSAERLVAAKDESERRAAVLEGTAFLNASPILLWPEDEKLLPASRQVTYNSTSGPIRADGSRRPATGSAGLMSGPSYPVAAKLSTPPSDVFPETAEPPQDISPEALKKRDAAYHSEIEKMVKELEQQAHFVAYAPPSFMRFHNGAYLQISLITTLNEGDGGSIYRMAALAFDRHINHMIRPVMAYFKDRADFSGIDFSTSIRVTGAGQENGSAVAVEYIFSLRDLRRYQDFDITGQELIRSGFVLVNGERISLDLQEAEGKR